MSSLVRIATVAAHFGRDLEFDMRRIAFFVDDARRAGASVLVFPDGTLGGCHFTLPRTGCDTLPPALGSDDKHLHRIAGLAAEMVVCAGYHEAADDGNWYNSAVCVTGDGILGRHRQVHQPSGEPSIHAAGDRFAAFDTPVGRFGMVIDYDKVFPESARTLALDGARVVACLSAWPAAGGRTTESRDRQARLFDLYDCARAAENQIVFVSANQTGSLHGVRFVGQAKVVDSGGVIRARTGARPALAVAELDLDAQPTGARHAPRHLDERRPDSYASV
ncbi:carbon-nitrogen hydrolase family protein [Amycolatopsis sp. NPDC058986]|uniref:carbon-nitrogen hydrolase family protein n=1 Tax=unclassified Amycolatopsis TaxID=2618356 RepID=UPI0036723153